jgi:hypothetical protein
MPIHGASANNWDFQAWLVCSRFHCGASGASKFVVLQEQFKDSCAEEQSKSNSQASCEPVLGRHSKHQACLENDE